MENIAQRKKVVLEALRSRREEEHFHQEIELLYVLDGSLDVSQKGQTTLMRAHDIFIVNSGESHALNGSDDVLYLKLSIQYGMIRDVVDVWELSFRCDSTRNRDDAYQNLKVLLRRLLARYLGGQGDAPDFLYLSLCYRILDFLCTHFLERGGGSYFAGGDDGHQQRVAQIRNYIQNHFNASISLKELSDRFYLSAGYFSRFFHKNFGMSFSEYLKRVRLRHAMDELLYSALPITRIVYDCGFANVTVFNKAFKEEYGETPSSVRKRAGKAQAVTEEPLSEETKARLKDAIWSERLPPPDDGREEKRSVTLSARESVPFRRICNEVINVGSASDLLRSGLREHIVRFRSTLGFSYVRVWSPFSPQMLIDPEQTARTYNFARLDEALDFLVENGIRPFLELLTKPERLTTTANYEGLIWEEIGELPPVWVWKRFYGTLSPDMAVRKWKSGNLSFGWTTTSCTTRRKAPLSRKSCGRHTPSSAHFWTGRNLAAAACTAIPPPLTGVFPI